MKRFALLVVVLSMILNCGFSQKIKVKKVKNDIIKNLYHEVYYVRKNDNTIKEGLYQQFFDGKLLAEGSYTNNQKNGRWNYESFDKSLKFYGNFQDDKQVGKWEYFLDGNLLSVLYFTDGIIDSAFGYFASGKINCIEKYDKDGNGFQKIYYENGQVKYDIPYKNRKINGTVNFWFENGQLHRELDYRDSVFYSVLKTYNKDGKLINGGILKEGNGSLITYYFEGEPDSMKIRDKATFTKGELNGKFEKYNKNGTISEKGFVKNGFKDGEWITYDSIGKEIFSKVFDESDSIERIPVMINLIPGIGFIVVENTPEFPGGETQRLKYLMNSIEYPQEARECGISGTVYITFVISRSGKITNVEVLRGVSKEINEEALKVIKKMPYWKPGFHNGIPVQVQFSMPLRFTLAG